MMQTIKMRAMVGRHEAGGVLRQEAAPKLKASTHQGGRQSVGLKPPTVMVDGA